MIEIHLLGHDGAIFAILKAANNERGYQNVLQCATGEVFHRKTRQLLQQSGWMSRVDNILMVRAEEGELANEQDNFMEEEGAFLMERKAVLDEEGANVAKLNA